MSKPKRTAADFIFVSKFIHFKEAFKTTLTGRMLTDYGIIIDDIPIVDSADCENVAGLIVIGTLPLFLSPYADAVISTYLIPPNGDTLHRHTPLTILRASIVEEFYYLSTTMTFNDMMDA